MFTCEALYNNIITRFSDPITDDESLESLLQVYIISHYIIIIMFCLTDITQHSYIYIVVTMYMYNVLLFKSTSSCINVLQCNCTG